jgi:hypothetical protein
MLDLTVRRERRPAKRKYPNRKPVLFQRKPIGNRRQIGKTLQMLAANLLLKTGAEQTCCIPRGL